MRAECIQATEAAIGRPITAGEARGIEQRVRDGMLAVAREDAARWQGMSHGQRLAEGAQRAAEDLVAEAQKKKQRLQLAILAHDRVEQYVTGQVARGADETPVDALSRMIAGKSDGKNNGLSAESLGKGIVAQSMGRLTAAWEAIRPGMLGFLANNEAEAQFVRALHGDTRGSSPEIVKAAKAWEDAADAMRQRFNAAGGVIGKLDNWGMPHAWSQDLAIKGGKDKFVADMLGWVDRRKYVHDDGRLYTDDEMKAFLGEAWVTVVTNGANKTLQKGDAPPGGRSVKANRNSQARQIHLKDGASSLAALRTYSGRNVFDAMVGHVSRMSRDIALVETFGPNADLTVQHFLDRYRAEMAEANPTEAGKAHTKIDRVTNLYDFVAGNAEPPPNRRLANAASMVRAWLTASKLGSAAITSISDEGTLYLTAHVNNIPVVKVFLNELRALNPLDQTEKRLAQRAGLLAHTMADHVDRFGTETLGSQIPDKIAAAVMRVSGLNAITEARRRAFSVTMMDALGAVTREFDSVDKLDPGDWRLLQSKGITQAEWDVWRAATPETWRGNDTVLTPDAIYAVPDAELARIAPGVPPTVTKERAASKLLAVVLEEQDIAVIEPGARERSMIQAGTVRGTVKGELVRSFFQFKTFPIAMMVRHWQRGLGMYAGTGGKVGYIGTLMAAQTLLGAVAMEANDILSGRDPRPLAGERAGRNWLSAVLKGGSLGLYGDFLFAESTDYGRTLLGAVAGPMAGLVEDVDDLTRGNIVQAMRGDETDAGAEFVRFLRGNTPGSSLWYTKAATDRLVFHQLQEYFSPGYLRRSKARAQETYGTSYWWDPGAAPTEARPPDVAGVAGQ